MERRWFDGMVAVNKSLQKLMEEEFYKRKQVVVVSLKPNQLAQALSGRS